MTSYTYSEGHTVLLEFIASLMRVEAIPDKSMKYGDAEDFYDCILWKRPSKRGYQHVVNVV